MRASVLDNLDDVVATPDVERMAKAFTAWAGRLADEPGETDWMLDAKCKDHPEVDFHPVDGDGVIYAQQVCDKCPVRKACLEYAMRHGEDHGVWGGYSERGRRRLRRVRAAARREAT